MTILIKDKRFYLGQCKIAQLTVADKAAKFCRGLCSKAELEKWVDEWEKRSEKYSDLYQ